MAYAKLSASLLACNDARPAPRLVPPVSALSVFPASTAAHSEKLAWHLKALKLPTFLDEHDNLARQCAADGLGYSGYLLRLAELELIDRERRLVERRIKGARFPVQKSLDSFDLAAVPPLNKSLVVELARCEYVARRENIIVVGNSETETYCPIPGAGCDDSLPVSSSLWRPSRGCAPSFVPRGHHAGGRTARRDDGAGAGMDDGTNSGGR